MRLATRALIAALATLVLCVVVSGQTLRSPEDPRNLSPAVGTGGPPGGPTGLFTIYDGQTIRRGEFTFSIAYSNFDRDPGDVDIVEIPVSFNIGLNDHVELWFSSVMYRGVKVNAPANLSSFYLPNSQLKFPALGSGPAIVLAPTGNVGTLAGTAVFRPAFNQPFVQFPFVGGPAGTFGLTPPPPGAPFGFPGFNAVLGPASGGTSTFGAAASYPGIGSPVGSILPGIVLATTTLPPTILGCPTGCVVPATFTIAPSYLPEAPFINRLYGQSFFNNMVFGAKIRLTGPNNAFGFGFVPFYRWWMDKGNDFSGFNQMQRGAGPGGDIGDFGLVMFADGRLSEHVNLSANIGYILNSNPKDPNDFTMLDRPDELLAGVGLDLPLTEHFQLIGEVKSVQYLGGTPNAFNNNPVDALVGAKIYPARWWGFGFAFRRHLNPQDIDRFEPQNFNVTVNQVTNVFVPGRGIVVVPSTTVPATDGSGRPRGFTFSEDPNGYIVQFFIGHRNPRILPRINVAPTVSVSASSAAITLPCPPGQVSETCTPSATRTIELNATAVDPDNDTLLYTWSVTGGTLSGEGRTVTWDLSTVNPGTYTASVEVNDGNQHLVTGTTTVTVAVCENCRPPCPTVSVSCPSEVDQGQPITFTASVGPTDVNLTYNWSVSAGTISSGQGTSSIQVDTTGLGGQTVTATLELGGLDPACSRTASCSTTIRTPIQPPTKFDEYGDIRFNDEKARLDNFAIQLQNQPDAQGYIIAYGNCVGAAQARADRAKDYLVNTRGIDAGRLVTIDGGCRADLTVELWIVPSGATPPAADASRAVDPCPECRTPRRRTRRGRDEE